MGEYSDYEEEPGPRPWWMPPTWLLVVLLIIFTGCGLCLSGILWVANKPF